MSYDYRPVTPGDLDLVCRHRREMFMASGRSEDLVAPMDAPFRAWLEPKLAAGAYFGWIVEDGGNAVAGLGMMIIDWPPHPSHPLQGARGYILNVYVEPSHRGHGLAAGLMARATDEGRRRGLDLMVLHATAMGRPMYEKLGWAQTSEMSLRPT
ncbi:MAG: family N-acetyltransferase [Phenylobacterium sp.]|nr:family N-acetyltransferase [Phenylobacterium sp.]